MRPASPALLLIGVALTALGASAAPAAAEAGLWRSHADHVLGTSFDMAVSARSRGEADLAMTAARAEIERLDKVLSTWRADSEIAAVNDAAGAKLSPDLHAVLSACEAWRTRTGGAFSARLGEAQETWAGATTVPAAETLCAQAAAADLAQVDLDARSRTIAKPSAVRFAPDGLAKGYIIDAALEAARRAAPCARGMMIDIGGDLRCWGDGMADGGWTVGIADPGQRADNAAPASLVRLSDRALAVSGPGARDRRIGEAAFSHLLDPATGQPAPRQQSAVVAHRAADADALATALAVLAPADGVALAEQMDGVEALVLADGRRFATTGWAGLERAAGQCQAAASLPKGFVVQVDYELPKIEAANYRKPYVVAWVTDENKVLVRTLAILGAKQDYLEDNYVWWRRYGRKAPEVIAAVAKPTRAPGRYTVGWDGADEKGVRVAQGRYTIHIEAAREHGGHAYQSIDVDLGPAAAQGSAPAKDELGAAKLRYGKKK